MQRKPLGDLCDVVRGSSPRPQGDPRYYGGIVPRLMVSDLTRDGMYVVPRTDSLTEAGAKLSRPMLAGDVVIAVSGNPGLPAILKTDACIHDGFVGLRKLNPCVDAEYLYYNLLFNKQNTKSLAVGAIFKNLTTDQIKELSIPLPDYSVQKEIAHILSQADKARQQRKAANALTEQFLQSTFLSLFGDPVRNEKGWDVKRLEDVATINPRMDNEKGLADDYEVSFIPMAAVSDAEGRIIQYKTRALREVRKGFTYFREEDVLMAKITPCMENGKATIARKLTNGVGFGTTEFHVIRCGGNLLPEYVYSIIRMQRFRDIAEENMTGSAGQRRVPTDFLKQFSVPLPPLKLQQQFAAIVAQTEALRQRQQAHAAELEGMFQGLLQRYFG